MTRFKVEKMETSVWSRCPEAADFFENQFLNFVDKNLQISRLAERFYAKAGVRLQNLVDHWVFCHTPDIRSQLESFGFEEIKVQDSAGTVWVHPGARLPNVRLETELKFSRIAIAVENLSDFIEANDFPNIGRHGDVDSGFEEVRFLLEFGELAVLVRQGYSGFSPGRLSAAEMSGLKAIRSQLKTRNREGEDRMALSDCHELVANLIAQIGRDRAVDEFFASEREFYMNRNRVAIWQFDRQQEQGIGWANHDHHTYRSSRELFQPLLALWHEMGFVSRERFYAGVEAGWGAQVLEHPISRVVLFCDVDIAPEELNIDFSRDPLPGRNTLGTIGLWCGLHGDSINQAGMHHLEAEFDFSQTEKLLQQDGFGVMPPFTDLPMLKQAFIKGEVWQVSPTRVESLLQSELITCEQSQRFLTEGATGSHLEILQRWEGFKGFNKTGIDVIIKQTDARN